MNPAVTPGDPEKTVKIHPETGRRDYWKDALEEAHVFNARVMAHPVADCRERLVPLEPAAARSGAGVSFSTLPHALGRPRLFLLREGLVDGFLAAARSMNRRGWAMRVEDGFRDRFMQKHIGRRPEIFDAILEMVRRELGGETPTPGFMFRRFMTLVSQVPKTGTHMSGSALDISVLDLVTGREVDRGAAYLEMSELTPMGSPFAGPAARRNREEITAIMREAGFVAYPYEFWHYSAGDAFEAVALDSAEPARYGAIDRDPATGAVTPLADPARPLNTLEEIETEIRASLRRGKN